MLDLKFVSNKICQFKSWGVDHQALRIVKESTRARNFTGGVDGGRGWVGDVKRMFLDISKIKSTGWRPKYNSEESVRLTVRKILSKQQ